MADIPEIRCEQKGHKRNPWVVMVHRSRLSGRWSTSSELLWNSEMVSITSIYFKKGYKLLNFVSAYPNI